MPPDHARSPPQIRAFVTSGIRITPNIPVSFRLRPAARRCAPATIRYALLSSLLSTFLARRPQTEAGRLYSSRYA